LAVAVLLRIGVDDHRRRAFALRREGLEAAIAIRVRIPNDYDLAFRIDSVLA
jgi:hypothetical protein